MKGIEILMQSQICNLVVVILNNSSLENTAEGEGQRNWVFATNSYFIIPISLQSNVIDLRYLKFWIMIK